MGLGEFHLSGGYTLIEGRSDYNLAQQILQIYKSVDEDELKECYTKSSDWKGKSYTTDWVKGVAFLSAHGARLDRWQAAHEAANQEVIRLIDDYLNTYESTGIADSTGEDDDLEELFDQYIADVEGYQNGDEEEDKKLLERFLQLLDDLFSRDRDTGDKVAEEDKKDAEKEGTDNTVQREEKSDLEAGLFQSKECYVYVLTGGDYYGEETGDGDEDLADKMLGFLQNIALGVVPAKGKFDDDGTFDGAMSYISNGKRAGSSCLIRPERDSQDNLILREITGYMESSEGQIWIDGVDLPYLGGREAIPWQPGDNPIAAPTVEMFDGPVYVFGAQGSKACQRIKELKLEGGGRKLIKPYCVDDEGESGYFYVFFGNGFIDKMFPGSSE